MNCATEHRLLSVVIKPPDALINADKPFGTQKHSKTHTHTQMRIWMRAVRCLHGLGADVVLDEHLLEHEHGALVLAVLADLCERECASASVCASASASVRACECASVRARECACVRARVCVLEREGRCDEEGEKRGEERHWEVCETTAATTTTTTTTTNTRESHPVPTDVRTDGHLDKNNDNDKNNNKTRENLIPSHTQTWTTATHVCSVKDLAQSGHCWLPTMNSTTNTCAHRVASCGGAQQSRYTGQKAGRQPPRHRTAWSGQGTANVVRRGFERVRVCVAAALTRWRRMPRDASKETA